MSARILIHGLHHSAVYAGRPRIASRRFRRTWWTSAVRPGAVGKRRQAVNRHLRRAVVELEFERAGTSVTGEQARWGWNSWRSFAPF
jgi:hypothetical protein